MYDLEALAIKAARGNNGGVWAEHYTEAHKQFWRQFVRDLASAEREACARLASGSDLSADCDDRGVTDPETGEVPCSAETRGEVCVCAERLELAHKIAAKIRARAIA